MKYDQRGRRSQLWGSSESGTGILPVDGALRRDTMGKMPMPPTGETPVPPQALSSLKT